MDGLRFDLLICKWDKKPLRFLPSQGQEKEDRLPEGLLVCPDYPVCSQVYLVTEGIIIALPEELMDEDDRKLLAQRVTQLMDRLRPLAGQTGGT